MHNYEYVRKVNKSFSDTVAHLEFDYTMTALSTHGNKSQK